jgi:hypothetical protein
MASPKMLVQRAEQANLQPRAFYLNRPPKPKTMMRGDYASLLRACAVNANEAMHQRVAAGNEGRDIPTGGSGRRRAKAIRNRAAGEAIEAPRFSTGGWVTGPTEPVAIPACTYVLPARLLGEWRDSNEATA